MIVRQELVSTDDMAAGGSKLIPFLEIRMCEFVDNSNILFLTLTGNH